MPQVITLPDNSVLACAHCGDLKEITVVPYKKSADSPDSALMFFCKVCLQAVKRKAMTVELKFLLQLEE